MDDREKMIELFNEANREFDVVGDPVKPFAHALADYLIANGATMQRWIPVTERLPELTPCNAGTAYSEAVLIWTSGKKAMVGVWDGVDFNCPAGFWDAAGERVTHWMPLPEPPKEDE